LNVLVIGSGGREHALAWKIARSPRVAKVFVAPGNGGTALETELTNVPITDIAELTAFARREQVGLTVVGPEAPLAAGVVDAFRAAGLAIFGPTRNAAQLESSKDFAKAFMVRHGIPTAAYRSFTEAAAAHAYVAERGAPIVVKADGLAAGKGVVVAQTVAEAEAAIDMICADAQLGAELVVEEFLAGEEASFFVLSDGEHALPLATAQDHKRVLDGDQGPNTGGMGAYSPAPVMTPQMRQRALDEIVTPTIHAMKRMGAPYKGVLYAGLMITAAGPKLIEYNVRFGDPECQVLMLRLKSDLVPALIAARDGMLRSFDLRWSDEAALTVVMAAKGYPGSYRRGSLIEGLDAAAEVDGVEIFHAGTKQDDGRVLANGGRVLNVSALGKTVGEAQARAYAAVDRIRWPDGFCRRDIGWQAVKREKPPT
jgi:phosphoribosylamine--glycine ligase